MTWYMITSILLFNLFLGISQAQTSPRSSETMKPRNLLLVVNQGDQSMSLVDPEAGVQIGKVKTNEVRAHEVVASADGRLAYLPIYGNSGVGKPGTDGRSVEIVDLDKQAIVGSMDCRPGAAALGQVRTGRHAVCFRGTRPCRGCARPPAAKKVGSIPTEQAGIAHGGDFARRPPCLHRQCRCGNCFRAGPAGPQD